MKQKSIYQIYGKKLGMTRVFVEGGESVPVTVLQIEPNVICQVKTVDNDGYKAIQVGLGQQKAQRLPRALANHYGKAQSGMFKLTAELRLDREGQRAATNKDEAYAIGGSLTMEGMFEVGKLVDVVGTSMGKGFGGVMKRHGMKGNPMTRGTHEYRRHGGSIGNRKFPGRVFKNKRMPGHMGVDRITQVNLEVVSVRPEENLLLVKGSVPGGKNEYVLIRNAVKSQA